MALRPRPRTVLAGGLRSIWGTKHEERAMAFPPPLPLPLVVRRRRYSDSKRRRHELLRRRAHGTTAKTWLRCKSTVWQVMVSMWTLLRGLNMTTCPDGITVDRYTYVTTCPAGCKNNREGIMWGGGKKLMAVGLGVLTAIGCVSPLPSLVPPHPSSV